MNTTMKKTLCMILAAAMICLMAACGAEPGASPSGGSTSSGGEITLAFVGPQTGDNAEYGKSMKTAMQIAIDEWNEKGGVIGKTIKLVDFDDANTSEQAASIAEKIVGDKSISAVVGHFSSGVAMTAAEVYQESGVALVNGSAAHIDFAKIGDAIFRNNAVYFTDANTMLQIAAHFGYKNIGILNPNTDAGLEMSAAHTHVVRQDGRANIGGIVCDGAKSSCAAKIASAVDAAILAHNMSMRGRHFEAGEGFVQKDIEETIKSLGYIGRVGMKATDVEILKVMLGQVDL